MAPPSHLAKQCDPSHHSRLSWQSFLDCVLNTIGSCRWPETTKHDSDNAACCVLPKFCQITRTYLFLSTITFFEEDLPGCCRAANFYLKSWAISLINRSRS